MRRRPSATTPRWNTPRGRRSSARSAGLAGSGVRETQEPLLGAVLARGGDAARCRDCRSRGSRRATGEIPWASRLAMRPFALVPGEGVSVDNPVGGVLTFKATSDQSGGGLTAIDTVAAPGEGPPLHVHRDEDEFIYILEGSFKVKLGNELIEAAPGSFVFI